MHRSGTTPRRLRLLLADDHALVAEGLRSMLEGKFDVVGVVEDGRALVREAAELKPDVVLCDISMPELNGLDAARQLKKILPKTKVIIVTMHTDATFVTEALRTGVSGYVLKRSAPQELTAAIDRVMHGRTYVSPLLKSEFAAAAGQKKAPGDGDSGGLLTARQREVLQLIAEGRSGKEIAATLHISPKTVEFHKSGIMHALGLRGTAELVRYAIRQGIISA